MSKYTLPVQRTRRSTFSRRSAAFGSSRMKCSSPSVRSSRLGGGAVEAQQALGGEDDQRPRLADQRLAAQQVEVLGGGGRVGDADVALGAEGEEALDAGAGVLRARALVAVRQQHRQAAGLAPLRLAGDDEAVDDHLGGVGEVAELRLPEDQRARASPPSSRTRSRGRRSPRAGCCGARRGPSRRSRFCIGVYLRPVFSSWRTRWRWEKVPRSVSWPVRRMWTPSVSSEPKASASAWPKSMPPFSSASTRLSSGRRSLRWTLKPSGVSSSSLFRCAQLLGGDARCRPAGWRCGRAVRRCWWCAGHRRVLVLARLHLLAQLLQRRRHLLFALLGLALDVLGADRALADQLLGVDLRDRLVGLDRRRHHRLRVGGLVGLVVAEAAVADHVDDDVAAPALAVGHRQAHGGGAGLDVVGVDVDDRDVEALRHVGRVGGRARLLGVGGEADLVVLDDVDRAAGAVALQRLQVERLGDDSLGREGGVAVEQHRHRPSSGRGAARSPRSRTAGSGRRR